MTSIDENNQTLHAYNANVDLYLKSTPAAYGTPHKALKEWIDNALSYVKPGGTILEIGSATPRDAIYMRNQGFTVQCSDGAASFVDHLNAMGEPAVPLNIIHESTDKSYDMVFANAVFPHFTNEDAQKALTNIRDCLNPDGILAFNVKQGEGEEWVKEKMAEQRYIHYWQPHEIYEQVQNAGYEVLLLEDGIEGDLPTHIWTRIIAQKR
jgi:cyclopropane fatty-acyl-phospholipid synthase-like methyltransferase